MFTLSVTPRQLPQSGSQGETDCHTSVATLVRNDTFYFNTRYKEIPYAIFRWHRGFFGLCYSLGGVQASPPEPPPEPPEPEEPPLLLGMGVVRAVEAAI